jgi:signal transduction histidine kinase
VPTAVAAAGGEQVLSFPGEQPGRGTIWVPVAEQGQVLGFIAVADARLGEGLDAQTLATIGVELGVAYKNQQRLEEGRQRELERIQSAAQSDKLRALGQMAGGVAHDLNQSLAMVMGYADFAHLSLEQGTPDVEKLRQLLDIVTQAAITGSETVKRLLIFARPRQETPPEPVDLATLLREVAQLTAPRWRDVAQAEGRQISLHVEGADDLTVEGWPAALRDALTNLVFNAVDAMPQGGTIRLRATRRGDSVAVDVTDSGTGMSREVQAKIFEPFFTTKGEGGTGLGLAQVFSTVERHRGQITVQSTEGRGTTFRLTIPAVERVAIFRPTLPDPAATERAVPGEPTLAATAATARVLPIEPRPEGTRAALGQRRLRVLAVDDEPNLRDLVGLMLEREGHAVTQAASGEEALEHLEAGSFDLVISDVGMGAGINGWELGRQVRARFPGVRFALATGWGAQIDPAEARAIGVEAIIAKPYRAADLQRLSAGVN